MQQRSRQALQEQGGGGGGLLALAQVLRVWHRPHNHHRQVRVAQRVQQQQLVVARFHRAKHNYKITHAIALREEFRRRRLGLHRNSRAHNRGRHLRSRQLAVEQRQFGKAVGRQMARKVGHVALVMQVHQAGRVQVVARAAFNQQR